MIKLFLFVMYHRVPVGSLKGGVCFIDLTALSMLGERLCTDKFSDSHPPFHITIIFNIK